MRQSRCTNRYRGQTRCALLALLPALALLAITACQEEAEESGPREVPRNVRVLTLATTSVTEYFEIAGPMQPVRGTDVSAEEQGTVAAVVANKGERVKGGDVLIELDRRLLRANRDAARTQLQVQDYNYDKVKQLYDAGKISRIELLTAESQYEGAQAAYDIAEVRYERAQIKAPFAGIVADRFVEAGQLVSPGMRVSRVIDPFTLKLVGHLTEREVVWVDQGIEADVILEGTQQVAAGTVAWVGFEADRLNGKFPVEIRVDNARLAYRSGVIGRARVKKRTLSEVIAIPRGAVIPAQGSARVFVIEGDRAVLRIVTLGADQGLMVIVESGLTAGEQLVVRGHRELIDGSLVHITETTLARDGSLAGDPAVVKSSAAETRVHAAPESLPPAGAEAEATSSSPEAGR